MGQRAKGAGAKDRLMLCALMLERPREGELGERRGGCWLAEKFFRERILGGTGG